MSDAVPAAVRQHFVGRDAAVQRAYEHSESFRDLCRDYLTCLAALGRWKASSSADAGTRSAEYAELLAELAREMEARLDDRG